jgi:hypothetical protein
LIPRTATGCPSSRTAREGPSCRGTANATPGLLIIAERTKARDPRPHASRIEAKPSACLANDVGVVTNMGAANLGHGASAIRRLPGRRGRHVERLGGRLPQGRLAHPALRAHGSA